MMNVQAMVIISVLGLVCSGCTGFYHKTLMGGSYETSSSAQIPVLNWEQRSDWVNVKDSGAVGDGVADDTAAIQKVLSGVTHGTTVYFPPGVYRITRTLILRSEGRLQGVHILGHGRDTQLVWDGEAGEKMWIDDGVIRSQYMGVMFQGQEKAAVGIYHHNAGMNFETEVRHAHLAFFNFTEAGIMTHPHSSPATAEVMLENCLFVNCGKGVAINKFNDYNYTFDGCEFLRCGTGVYANHGNFYIRNCRFEGSRDADIDANPEHGCSIRRSVSVGSFMFLKYANAVAPLTLQDCRISGWKNPEGAILYGGAPFMMLDCVFSAPPESNPPVNITYAGQQLILSENRLEGDGELLRADPKVQVFIIPAGKRSASLKSANQRFLKSQVNIPGKVFDAKRDFGAKGNGKDDDTAAIQNCIDAARKHGRGAIAYLPSGGYNISQTLTITGKDYTVGGSGFWTMLNWKGDEGGTMVAVHDPQDLVLENITVGNHDVIPIVNSGQPLKNSIDILQTSSGRPSRMLYEQVFVFGKYQKQPDRKGLVFRGLGNEAVVRINGVEGNLRFTDCAAATILANTTYEGSVTVEGRDPRRTGFLGFMTRLGTIVSHGLYIRDNHSVVMSDFYIEQSDGGCVFEGGPGLPEGRVTIQNPKFHFGPDSDPSNVPGDPITINNYAGNIFLGHSQAYPGKAKTWRIVHTGDRPVTLWIYSAFFYLTPDPAPELQKSGTLYMLAVEKTGQGESPGPMAMAAQYAPPPDKIGQLSEALDDLRRLGEMDLKLNYVEAGF